MRTYKWIDDPIEGLRAPWRKNYYFNVNLSADALIDHASRRWNYGALNDNFVPGDVEIINRNQPVVSREDFFVWKYNKSGLISVKSAYWLASSLKTSNRLRDVICLPSINPIKEKVWALHTSPKLKKWVSPPGEWLMCNFAFDWCKVRSLMGAAWVLRNGRGVVVCHGRRAFSAITSKDQAKLQVVLWTVESMRSMRFDKVVFAGEMEDLFGAVNRPQAWPSFLFQVGEIESEARGIEDVRWQVITKDQNGGATFIAQSVTNQNRMQSYVARSHPIWLSGFFASERCGL
ncbi:LOW QUALITY PROTEIN: hypothetical protein HID58_019464 [Brassica napus]|uniref:RNase H type-1 domain-containing protein n=1 Tax=Brassica napus TaxID=3708 RepID=A0ABQ8DCY3_BRANA|nr:LOW QUALITY PROTEIN: hypothetical protein HID58_019464 [Brassica napus]